MRPTAAKTVWESTRRGIIGGMGAPAVASLDPSLRDALDVARGLGVDPTTGLTMSDAEHRLQSDGPNELRAKPPVPLWRKILAQFQDPLIYLLLVAVAISVAAWLTQGAAGLPIDALVISAIVLLNGILGFVQERKAETAVAALQSMTAAMSTVLRNGELYTVPSTELVCGDILALSEGDAVGADGRLLSATALRVSEASLTGESESVTKNVATLSEPRTARRPQEHGLPRHRGRPRRGAGGDHRDRHGHRDGRHRRNARGHRGGTEHPAKGDRPASASCSASR